MPNSFDTFPIQIFYSGTFSRYLHSRSTPSLKVLPLGWNSLNIFGISLKYLRNSIRNLWNIFEGLAVGLESSSSSVWTMFAAIASHKFVVALLQHCSNSHFHTRPLNLQLHLLEISPFANSPFPRFVITFCVSLELLQAGTSTVGFSLALITFSLVRWHSCLFA